MGAQLCMQYLCMHSLESGCHPSLGTNMPDGVTRVRASLKKKQFRWRPDLGPGLSSRSYRKAVQGSKSVLKKCIH